MLDERDIAEMYPVSLSWLRNKRCLGYGIPFMKMKNGRVFYKAEDVKNYFKKRAQKCLCTLEYTSYQTAVLRENRKKIGVK